MAEIRFTLIPQFTIRWILALTTVMAVVSLVIAQAVRGAAWANGIVFGLLAVAVAFCVYAATFGCALAFSGFFGRARQAGGPEPSSAEIPPDNSTPPAPKPPRLGSTGVIMLLTLATSFLANVCHAASGGVLNLPPTGPGTPPNKSGLTLSVDTAWVDGYGYRPVRVDVKSLTGPVTGDRVLTLKFKPMFGYSTQESVSVSQTVEIPAGSAGAKATIAVPQLGPWGMFALETYEDGLLVKELSLTKDSVFASWSGTDKGDGVSPVALLLSGSNSTIAGAMLPSGAAGELMTVNGRASPPIQGGVVAAPAITTSTTGAFGASLPTTADLPTQWIDYSGFDLIVGSLSDFQSLAANQPAQWNAIQKWLHGGGTLIVYGAGNRWEKLPELESLVATKRKAAATEKPSPGRSSAKTGAGSDASSASGKEGAKNLLERGWESPLKSTQRMPLENGGATTVFNPDGTVQQIQFGNNNTDDAADSESPATRSGKGPPLEDGAEQPAAESESQTAKQRAMADRMTVGKTPFMMRAAGLGMTVAVRGDESFNASQFNWPWLYNSLGTGRWQWYQRYGVSLVQENDDFWNFLIPGVGLAPVVQFQILITLFVIAIGPVNYYVLKRMGKLNLTVLIVPLSALAVTGALFAYALIADGLSVRVRARSFTHIDQRSGEAVCWSRLSYYAGLAPGNGLSFDDQTVVIPLQATPSDAESAPARVLDWKRTDPSNPNSPLEQNLPDGWLYSRTPTQFITQRVRSTTARLDVTPPASGQTGATSAVPQATNHLGSAIKFLVLVDDAETTYTADAVAADAVASLTKVDSQADVLIQKLQPMVSDNQPQVPLSMTDNRGGFFGISQRGSNQYGRNWRYRPNYNANVLPASQNNSALERSIGDELKQLMDNSFPSRHYLAVVDDSPEVQLGTPSAKPEACFHIIVGEW